ncbi:MAG: TonB-dependent receptor [Calditrichaeota bacterium]|nr:MAG: TonB-dependent receptor [Calditrichota bacterium]MBL1206145.1 TonB-dependent receptor [Calditrichota bacterium]NOG45970.1 TonB-dependent receptor [Calditrichota bacterium]
MLKNAVILSLIIPIVLFAQSGKIIGSVGDESTKEALFGANIVVLDESLGGSSAEDGTFIINDIPVGSYRIEVSFIGYVSQTFTDIIVRSSKPVTLKIELKPQNLESEAIVVSAGYFSEEKLTQSSVFNLQREEIRRFPGGFEDIVRTVTVLPGISINPAGGRNDLLVRGGGPSENLYIVNNIEVPNINHFNTQGSSSGSLSFINLDFVDDVKFSSGGFAARYGEKMSSILELNMSQGREDRFGGKALVSATQFGLNIEGPLLQNGNYIFSARKSYLDLIFKAAGLPFIPVYTDYNLITNYQISPANSLSFLSLIAVDNVDRNLDNLENRTKNARLLDNQQNQFINGMNWRHLHQNGFSDVTLSATLFSYRFSQADNNSIEYFNSKADELEYAAKFQSFSKINSDLDLRFGLTAKLLNNNNNTTFADSIFNRSGKRIAVNDLGINQKQIIDLWSQNYAAFVETNWNLNKNINLNLGLRINYYKVLEVPFYVAPRLGLKFQLNEKQSFKLNYGDYYQAPSNVWLINSKNKNLTALQNRMTILGWDYLVASDVRLTTELYYKKYSGLPVGILPGRTDYIVMSNTGSSYGGVEDDFQSFGFFDLKPEGTGQAYGFEILLQKKFSDVPIYGKASYSYGKSELKAFNRKTYPTRFDQRHIFNISGGYKIGSKWEVSGKFSYFSGIPYTPVYIPSKNETSPGSIQNLPEEYLSKRLDSGHHLDIRADRYFYFNNWTLIAFIDIQNVYNFKIPIRPQYDFWEDKIKTSSSLGILPSIGISAEF